MKAKKKPRKLTLAGLGIRCDALMCTVQALHGDIRAANGAITALQSRLDTLDDAKVLASINAVARQASNQCEQSDVWRVVRAAGCWALFDGKRTFELPFELSVEVARAVCELFNGKEKRNGRV